MSSNALTPPPGGRKRSAVTVRTPSRANAGLIENFARSDAIVYSYSTSSQP